MAIAWHFDEPSLEKKETKSPTFVELKHGTWFVFLNQAKHGPARICVRQGEGGCYYSFTDGRMMKMTDDVLDYYQPVMLLKKPRYILLD